METRAADSGGVQASQGGIQAHHSMTVPRDSRTVAGAMSEMALSYAASKGVRSEEGWPSSRYRHDPIAFARNVLGIEPWHRQQELLWAVAHNRRVAVKAGRKVSKSCSAAIVALWWFCSYTDSVVVMTSTTARQLSTILWRELCLMHGRSRRPIPKDDPLLAVYPWLRTTPVDGEPAVLAQNGLRSGHRMINGFTASDGVSAQGTSGAHLLYIIDEASGIEQPIFDAIIGNMAGSGGKVLLFGNPTRCEGEFYDAFESKRKTDTNPNGYECLTISSEESPNVVEGKEVIPGLASAEWIEDRKREWGESSPLYQVHVRGEFVREEEGKIIPLALIQEAATRWDTTPDDGILHIGMDPALAESGDESVFVLRRGLKILGLYSFRGLSPQGHLTNLLGFLSTYSRPREPAPVVVVDALGDVGRKVVLDVIVPYIREHEGDFALVTYRGSDLPYRDNVSYYHARDELWGNMADWLRNGGAIPHDLKLQRDLHAPSWSIKGQQKKAATPKEEMRQMLGRSPDRGDAACLACWDSSVLVQRVAIKPKLPPIAQPSHAYNRGGGFDVYKSLDWLYK